jgi:integrase
VGRVFAGLDVNRSTDVRDRAILMLFAIYGLRAGEVAKLRLDDIDWEHDHCAYRVPNGVRHKFTRFSLRSAEPSPITCSQSAAGRRRIVRYF